MKALSLWQPWASLVALGWKGVETRGRGTAHRGPLAIHATAGHPFPRGQVVQLGEFTVECDAGGLLLRSQYLPWPYRLPLGAVVATCDLVDVVPTEVIKPHWWMPRARWSRADQPAGRILVSAFEPAFGDYTPGRSAWLLTDVEAINPPVPARGRQWLWDWDPAATSASRSV